MEPWALKKSLRGPSLMVLWRLRVPQEEQERLWAPERKEALVGRLEEKVRQDVVQQALARKPRG
jgi:hypothetical protein